MPAKLSIQPQVHVHDRRGSGFGGRFLCLCAPLINQVLSECFRSNQMPSAKFFGFVGESTLRRIDYHFLTGERFCVVAGDAVNGMAFGHVLLRFILCREERRRSSFLDSAMQTALFVGFKRENFELVLNCGWPRKLPCRNRFQKRLYCYPPSHRTLCSNRATACHDKGNCR